MEWSRHDKVIITISAYIIGFTTAFIAFGIGNTQTSQNTIVWENVAKPIVVEKPDSSHTVSAVIESDGLRVTSEHGERLLSARKSAPFVASIISNTLEPGMHYAIIDAEISRDNKFVYYCEQLSEASESCDPYIYDVSNDVLHPVLLDGNDFAPLTKSHTSSWSPVGTLTVNYYASQNNDAPWLLYSS